MAHYQPPPRGNRRPPPYPGNPDGNQRPPNPGNRGGYPPPPYQGNNGGHQQPSPGDRGGYPPPPYHGDMGGYHRPPGPGNYGSQQPPPYPADHGSLQSSNPEDQLTEDLVYTLCQEDGGKKPIAELFRSLPAEWQQRFKTKSGFTQYLVQNNDVFAFHHRQGAYIVQPQTTLDICKNYTTKAGCRDISTCGGLHICKFFISGGQCKFPDSKCRFGHDLRTSHNFALLTQHRLSSLPLPYLKKVFEMSRNNLKNTAPKPCKFYNAGAKGCTRGAKCTHLHICRHFLKNSCTFNVRCKRCHDLLEPHNRQILERYGIDTRQTPKDLLTAVQAMCVDDLDDGTSSIASSGSHLQQPGAACSPHPRGLSPMVSPQKTPDLSSQQNLQRMRQLSLSSVAVDDEETEICMFHLRGQCGFGKGCRMHHKDQPYQWQYLDPDTDQWMDLMDSENAELNYSKVENDDCFICVWTQEKGKTSSRSYAGRLDFRDDTAMTVNFPDWKGVLKVRRLTTASSVQKPATFKYVTRWHWYWQDENNKWKQYGDENDKKVKSNATVEDIENAYLASTGHFQFDTTENHKYDLDFSRMVQKNITYKTERRVRRRPIDWKEEEAKNRSQRASANNSKHSKPAAEGAVAKQSSQKGSGAGDASKAAKDTSLMSSYIPDHWDIYASGDGDGVQIIKVDKSGASVKEYEKVEASFKATMPASTVKSIKRVQSMEVYDAYDRKKKWMKKNGKKDPKELHLFHGTKSGNIKVICEQGFDCRISGSRTGAMYGKGTYFGTTASVASGYADSKSMFICKVLVGHACQGMSHYVRPPPKDPQKPNENFYDSCVDRPDSPKMYIIFKPEQAYPEYIVEYD